jgi:hypothetical protein
MTRHPVMERALKRARQRKRQHHEKISKCESARMSAAAIGSQLSFRNEKWPNFYGKA